MSINDPLYTCAFRDKFSEYLQTYTQMFRKIPLKGEHFEELFVNTILSLGYSCDWTANSHKIGEDVRLEDGQRISLKSCRLPKKSETWIEYSSFRTTRQKTIEEKISYLDTSHYDRLICLARKDTISSTEYILKEMVQPFAFSDMKWSEDEINFVGIHPEGKAVIRKSRSHQLLMFVPPKNAITIHSITV